MYSGKHRTYWWFESSNGNLWKVVRRCPDIVLSRYIAMTTFDSGPLVLSEQEQDSGWVSSEGVAFSPLISSVDQLPAYDDFVEWYVFEAPLRFAGAEVFVNYTIFTLRAPSEPDEGETAPARQMQRRFWAQIEQLGPESFAAVGDALVVVTRNPSLAQCVSGVLSG